MNILRDGKSSDKKNPRLFDFKERTNSAVKMFAPAVGEEQEVRLDDESLFGEESLQQSQFKEAEEESCIETDSEVKVQTPSIDDSLIKVQNP